MSSFTDTSNWKRKDGTTLVYTYDHKGQRHDGLCEMEPQSVDMQLKRLSVLSETSWRIKDPKEADSEAGFFTREYINALGILDNCRLHAITLDENPNETSSRINVTVYPAPLEKLQATSVIDSWSVFRDDEKPEEGWLKDEVGSIRYHSAGEYHEASNFSASVLISQEIFDQLANEIKQGNLRSARLTVLADLYHFGYESLGAGMRGHYYNYAILCNDEGNSALWGTAKGRGGFTKARLQELTVEWSPKLDDKMAGRRDEDESVDDRFQSLGLNEEKDPEKLIRSLTSEVQVIRGRIDQFYQAALFGVALLVFTQLLAWYRG